MTGSGSPVRILDSPLRFYRTRAEMSPHWRLALFPVMASAALQAAAGGILSFRMQPHVNAALAQMGVDAGPLSTDILAAVTLVAGAAAYLGISGAMALVMVVLDLLFAQSGRVRRLVEFAGYSFVSQVPLAVAGLVLAIGMAPEPLRLPPDATLAEFPNIVRDYQEGVTGGTVRAVMQMVGIYFGLWLAALQAAALRVVSGFSVGGAWAAGILLAALFVGVPYAAQQLW